MCDILTEDGHLDGVGAEGSHFPGVCVDQVTSVVADGSAGRRSFEVSESGDSNMIAMALMRLVIFLSGLRVWLGSQLNTARHGRCSVDNPQTGVVSTDEVGLGIPDTQSPIADEFRHDDVGIKQSPEVADIRMSSVRSGNLEDSVSGIVLQDEVSQRKPDLSVPKSEDHCQGNCWY